MRIHGPTILAHASLYAPIVLMLSIAFGVYGVAVNWKTIPLPWSKPPSTYADKACMSTAGDDTLARETCAGLGR